MKSVQAVSEGQGNLVPVTGTYLLEHLESLTNGPVPVYRILRNSAGALRADPVDPASLAQLPVAERAQKQFLIDKDWNSKLFARADSFDAQLEELLEETPEDRAKAVGALKSALADLKAKDAEPMVKAKAIMDTVSQAFLLNKASLKLKPLEVTAHEKALAKDTTAIVATAVEMSGDPELVAGLFTAFQGLSNGQTINHVVRVFASYSGFLQYYNSLHRHGVSQVLRKAFIPVYRAGYRKHFPNLDEHLMNSDHLLQLAAFEPLELKEFALGAFLHDIGKMGNIDYFESDAAFDPQQIRQHVYLSAGLILMNYGNDHSGARLLAGDHHNGLGHPGGYGVTRLERERSQRPPAATTCCLSREPEGFISGQALGWLPVEMLAVADVYDAMIDDSRAYKKPMSPAQAVAFLEDTMVAQGKLDAVLVDLYIDFLKTQGLDLPADRGFQFKVGRSLTPAGL